MVSFEDIGTALPSALTCQSRQRGFLLHLLWEPLAQAGGNKLSSPEKRLRNYNVKKVKLLAHLTQQSSPKNKHRISYPCHSGM